MNIIGENITTPTRIETNPYVVITIISAYGSADTVIDGLIDGGAAAFDIVCTAETVTFADANPDTITLASSSWATLGVSEGDRIVISGSTSNDGIYTVDTITTVVNPNDTITLIGTDTLANETNTTTTISFESSNRWALAIETITGGIGYVTIDGMFSAIMVIPGTAAIVDVSARERR